MKKADIVYLQRFLVPAGIKLSDKELSKLYTKMCLKCYGQKWLDPDPQIANSFIYFIKND